MMIDLEKLLSSATRPDDLASAEEAAADEYAAAAAALDLHNAARKDLILSGSDEAVNKHESRASKLALQKERAELVLAEIRKKLAELEVGHQAAEIEAAFDEGQTILNRAIALLREQYEPACLHIVEILGQFSADTEAVRRINAQLDHFGDPRQIPLPEAIARATDSNTAFVARDWRLLTDAIFLPALNRYAGGYWGRPRD